jgi:tight adherence protein B
MAGHTTDALAVASGVAVFAAVALGLIAIGPVWDAIARRRVSLLAPELRSIRFDDARLPTYLRWWGGAMAASAVVPPAIGLPLLVPPLLYLVYMAPRYWLDALIRRRRTLLRDQMAVAGVALANTARAGLSLAQGLESIVPETPEPLATELRQVVNEFHRGRPLPEALTAAKNRLNLDGFTLFVSAILACLDRGGRVTDALDGISRSLQESQRLERKLDADTASGRRVVLLLGAFPAVFLAGFTVVDPDGTGLIFTTALGQVVLLTVIVMVYASVKLSQRILNLDI